MKASFTLFNFLIYTLICRYAYVKIGYIVPFLFELLPQLQVTWCSFHWICMQCCNIKGDAGKNHNWFWFKCDRVKCEKEYFRYILMQCTDKVKYVQIYTRSRNCRVKTNKSCQAKEESCYCYKAIFLYKTRKIQVFIWNTFLDTRYIKCFQIWTNICTYLVALVCLHMWQHFTWKRLVVQPIWRK